MSLLSCWKAGSKLLRINFKSTGQYFRFYSTGHRRSSPSLKVNPQELIEEKCDAFYVVRKGNHVGLYRSLSDCQSQVSSSICDPPVSVYKGYLLKNEAEKCFASRGLKNAIYSLNAKDLKEDIFGILVPCPLQEPAVASPVADLPENISVIIDEPVKKHLKLEYSSEQKQLSDNSMSCTLQFYGAPAGEDRHGGAGVILRTEDGSVISRLREGLGAVTPKAAQFIALIVGLKHALKRGFKQIHVQGDSQLVCMQMQGLCKAWKLGGLSVEANALKEMFESFSISHIKQAMNSDARALAALATRLPVGEICDHPVSVYKGYLLKKEAEKYLASRGLKNAVYSLNSKDLKEDLFEILVPCPFQEPTVASPVADLPEKISVITDEPVKEHLKLKDSSKQKQLKKHLKLKHSSKQTQLSDNSEPTVASPVADLPEKISVITDEPVKEHLKLKDSSKQKQLKKHLKLKHSSKQTQLSDNSEPTVASPVADLPEKISVITDEPVKEHLKLKDSSKQKQLKKHLKLKHSSKQKQLSDNSEPTVASPVADLPEKISVITDEPVKEHLKLKDSSKQKQLKKHLKLKHSSKQKQLSDNSEPTVASPVADLPEKISVITDEPVKEHLKLKHSSERKQLSDNFMSCTLEFYGASAVEAGKGGAGVILRTEDGSVISQLSEGLGAVTTEAAHYKALILGLKQAHKKGFKQIHVQSDSQLVCMQMQGLRKAEKLAELCDEAKALKEMFESFSISPVKKSKNSDVRAQAAIATDLPVGEVHEEAWAVANLFVLWFSVICDPPVSVYKGYLLKKETEMSCFPWIKECSIFIERKGFKRGSLWNPSSLSFSGQPAGMAHEHVLSHAATWLLWCSIDTEATPYRALILGLKHALKRGFKQIHVRSVSQLLGMQMQGLCKAWKLGGLSVEANALKDISPVKKEGIEKEVNGLFSVKKSLSFVEIKRNG
ncbi:hypothetical protein OPV22_026339 [Ensete ventricosum]|uniref:RNase H type-1 domain-containing protein n=1 Tax=Ensete ventricosum TaxID=4639 RepID=A0AAV8Q9Y1_ENSVE|nr:hypothetical protein OPV22_026339 [Ensete ventricosum]